MLLYIYIYYYIPTAPFPVHHHHLLLIPLLTINPLSAPLVLPQHVHQFSVRRLALGTVLVVYGGLALCIIAHHPHHPYQEFASL